MRWVQFTLGPTLYLTGFNETVVEAGLRWLNDDVNFIKRDVFKKVVDGLLGKPEGRLDPKDMIAKMVEVIPSREGKFLNIFPLRRKTGSRATSSNPTIALSNRQLLANDDDRTSDCKRQDP